MLQSSIMLLQEEVTNPDLTLVRARQDRVEIVKGIMGQVHIMLTELQKHAKKYETLGQVNPNSMRKW